MFIHIRCGKKSPHGHPSLTFGKALYNAFPICSFEYIRYIFFFSVFENQVLIVLEEYIGILSLSIYVSASIIFQAYL